VLGHEAVGRVVASRRPDAPEGRRVVWSLAASCGRCEACVAWRLPQKCRSLFKYGHAGPGWEGCFASHILLRLGTSIAEAPSRTHPVSCALAGCGVATGAEAALLAPVVPGRAVVLGAGPVGLAAAWTLRRRLYEVLVVDPDLRRQESVDWTGLPWAPAWNEPCDLVLEASGSPASLAEAPRLLRPGGTLILAGLVSPDTALPFPGEAIVRGCWTLHGIHNYPPDRIRLAVAAAENMMIGERCPDPWPLSRIDDAMAMAAEGRALRESINPKLG
jgi:threonine dehydrogenase-like Zn-dependent dehydrogenase